MILNWLQSKFTSKQSRLDSAISEQPAPLKKAIAILAYNNFDYFAQVFDSVLSQTINGAPFNQSYDLYIYQDGLQERHLHSLDQYEKIAQYAISKIGEEKFIRQPINLGTAMQFDFAERSLFIDHQYEFAVLLEHDFVLGPQYLEILAKLADQFRYDERIAVISGHSRHYHSNITEQTLHVDEYALMGHDWGAGVFQRAWKKRVPAMQAYYGLLKGIPFERRNNLLIQTWLLKMGFVVGSTSQDTIKAYVDSALGQLRISTYPNLGTYIGATGMNWDKALYEEKGYHQTVLFSGVYEEPAALSDEQFALLLSQQKNNYLADPAGFDQTAFLENMSNTDLVVPNNLRSFNMSAEDVIAAYKLFLNRFPENQDVLEQKLGVPPLSLLKDLLVSDEFLSRTEIWKTIVNAAKIVLAKNAAINPDNNQQKPASDIKSKKS